MTSNRRACPGCSSQKVAAEFRARGPTLAEAAFSVLRCEACGLGWTEPAPPPDEIGRWYPAAYYGKENVRFNPLIEWLVRWFRLRRAKVIAKLARPGPVLDIGCGRGFMLSFLRDLGFEPHGVEFSDAAAWHARNRLHIDVAAGSILEAPFHPEQFQAIILWHSLEHMSSPDAVLDRVKRLLKSGGILIVAVPNSDSVQAHLFGASWFHLDVPRHYFHFGRRSLKQQLAKLGFEVVREDHFSLEQNPYGWLQSIYNALGFNYGFLYSLIKNSSARMVSIREHPLQALLTLALLPIFLPVSLLMTVVEAGLRRGGTIELYAIKR